MRCKHERTLQELALFVHSVLFTFHGLGLLYNLRRKNWVDSSIHLFAGGYDLWAVRKHIRALKEKDDENPSFDGVVHW